MTALIIAGLVVALLAALVAARPLNDKAGTDEALLSLCERRDTLERQIAATTGDRRRGDIDPAFADDEQGRLELELLQVLEGIAAADKLAETLPAKSGHSLTRAGALFLLMVVIGGGLYCQSQQQWWQANLNDQITQEQPAAKAGVPMLANGQPDIDAMVKRLAARLADQPDDGAGWKRLGRSYYVMKRYEESADAYAKAAALLPEDYTLIQGYALSRLAQEAEQQREVPLAPSIDVMVNELRQRVEASPDDVDGYRAMAAIYVMVSRRGLAAEMYEQSLQRDPGDLDVAVAAAANQFVIAEGESTAAVDLAYERVAMLNPSARSVIWYRGYVAYHAGQWQQVLDYWQPLLEQLPEENADGQRIAEAVAEARAHLLEGDE